MDGRHIFPGEKSPRLARDGRELRIVIAAKIEKLFNRDGSRDNLRVDAKRVGAGWEVKVTSLETV